MKTSSPFQQRVAMTALASFCGLMALPAAQAQIQTQPSATFGLTFSFNFMDAAGQGFNDPGNGLARRDALQSSALQFGSLFGSYFSNAGTINMNVSSEVSPTSTTLAAAGSSSVLGAGAPAGFNLGEVVRTKLQTGVDLNGSAADGEVSINFGQNWQLDPSGSVNASQYDFYSTMSHEFLHALGWSSSISRAGASSFGSNNWGLYDSFLTNRNGASVIDGGSFALNAAVWNAASVGGTGNGLFFNGSFARAANGGNAVALYSPSPWEDGSSVSHLDNGVPALAPLMMTHATPTGPSARNLSGLEIAMLQDLGYSTVSAVPEPGTYALWLCGLAAMGSLSRRRRA